ncbi:MAG: histidine kinase dimerization/phospho-acceptor domain-containing protein [Armatimonadota bacterium]|nr:histidine kinase dimerization/phospho-acceptor domain-containing protein [Armatimonadota bacterium]
MSFRSIRMHVTAVFCLAIIVYLAIAWVGLVWYARDVAGEEADRILRASAARVRLELAGARSDEALSRLLAEERAEFSIDNVTLAQIRHNGKAVGSDGQGAVERSLIAGKGWLTRVVRTGQDVYIIGIPWKPWAGLDDHIWALLVLSLSALIAGAAGSWILVGRTLSPIALLSDQANAVYPESLHIRLQEPSADAEIVRLVATLNGLLVRLSEAAEAKGRFYSAASHELRTPLQALSGHLELALGKERSQEDYRQIIEEAYRQTRRLIVLVGDLLLLYRLESDASQPPLQSGDLTTICRQALVSCEPIIEQRGLRVLSNLPESAEFLAPPTHAHVLVRNLLENAAKYAEQGTELSVDLSVGNGRLELRIFNKRFHPMEGRDSPVVDGLFLPGRQSGGSGLGLAICQAIAAANSWHLSVERQAHGVCATLAMDVRAEDQV